MARERAGERGTWTSPVFLRFSDDASPANSAAAPEMAAGAATALCNARIDCVEEALRPFALPSRNGGVDKT